MWVPRLVRGRLVALVGRASRDCVLTEARTSMLPALFADQRRRYEHARATRAAVTRMLRGCYAAGVPRAAT